MMTKETKKDCHFWLNLLLLSLLIRIRTPSLLRIIQTTKVRPKCVILLKLEPKVCYCLLKQLNTEVTK